MVNGGRRLEMPKQFPDISGLMAFRFDIKRLSVYGWIALASLVLGTLGDMAQRESEIGQRMINDAWRLVFLVFVHYILFEYTIPRWSWDRFRSYALAFGHVF